MWTDDGRTTEASHTINSPGAFGSGELKINGFPFQRKEGMVVWRGRRFGCMGGGVAADGSNMIYNLQILH